MRCTALLLATIFLSPVAAVADGVYKPADPQSEFNKLMRSAAYEMQVVTDQFKEVLPSPERQMFDKIEIRLDKHQGNIFAVFAGRDNGKPIISVSAGYIDICRLVIGAYLYEDTISAKRNEPADMDSVDDYVGYIADTIIENGDRALTGGPQVEIVSYFFWIGLTEDEARTANDDMNNSGNAGLFRQSLAFVLGHELGHHVLGHVGRKTSEADEEAADDYSIKLLIKSKIDPSGMFVPMMLMNEFEAIGPETPKTMRSHPLTACRQKKALVASWDYVKNDRSYVEAMIAEGRRKEIDDMEKMRAEIEKSAQEVCSR
jgi:hypothetical protein